MNKIIRSLSLSIYLFIYNLSSYAGIYGDYSDNQGDNIGSSSASIAGALFGIANLWLAVATIAGIGFLFVGIVKYHEHRKNPQQTPLSQVFLMITMAIALIGVAFISKYGNSSYAVLMDAFG